MSFSTHIFLLLVLVNVCRAGWFFGPSAAEECIETGVVAARDGDLKGIQSCLDVGWNVNAKNKNGWTALHNAASDGKVDAIAALIKAGADVNAKNKDGKTALDLATEYKQTDAIQLLSTALKDAQATPLSKFLKSISFEKYFDYLVNCDYTTISDLKEASSADLKECGVSPKARKGIIKGLKSYKDEL